MKEGMGRPWKAHIMLKSGKFAGQSDYAFFDIRNEAGDRMFSWKAEGSAALIDEQMRIAQFMVEAVNGCRVGEVC